MKQKHILQPKVRFPEFEGDWDEKNISEILSIGSGKDYKHLNEGDIPVYGTGGLMTFVDNYIYDGESVGIGRKGTIDKPVFLTGKFWTVDTLFYTHKFSNSLPKFVYNLFQKINWQLYNEASGVPSLSKATIEKIKINIPSLPEQQKIADYLSTIDTKINLLEEKKAQLALYKKAMMQKLFSQEIRFKDEKGNDFSKWEEKRLGEIGEIVTGKTPDTTNKSLWNGNIQFITPSDLNDEVKYIDFTERTVVKLDKMKVLPMNTIVFTCIASIGKMALTKMNSITNQQINSLLPVNQINDFIYYALLNITPYIKSTQANTTLPIINKTEFSKFKINIPSLPEQQKIADFLSAIDESIEKVNEQITQTQSFKKAMLQQMFV